MSCRSETESSGESWTIRLLLQPSVSGVAVSLLVSDVTVDILNTFYDGLMVQCVKLTPSKILHLWYWFHALRQPLGSGVSPSTDLPSGTVCHQHYVRRICRRTPSSGHWRRISSHPSSDTESFRDFAAAYKSADLLTYLLFYCFVYRQKVTCLKVLPGTGITQVRW